MANSASVSANERHLNRKLDSVETNTASTGTGACGQGPVFVSNEIDSADIQTAMCVDQEKFNPPETEKNRSCSLHEFTKEGHSPRRPPAGTFVVRVTG